MRIFTLAMACILAGCGSKGQETTQSQSATATESVFRDWALAIPAADAAAIAELANVSSNPFVSPGMERTFEDIVRNKRLNLSGLSIGKNHISRWADAGGCWRENIFSISIYAEQIIISRTITSTGWACGSKNGTSTVESLYYKYTMDAGRLTVCGYDDANFTLERWCASSQ